MHRFPVGPLLSKPEGFRDHFDRLTIPAHFDDAPEISSKNPITFDLDLIKLAHEFTIHISNLEYTVPAQCSRCLLSFNHTIIIDSTSRQYIYDLPKDALMTDEEVEYIDQKEMVIDILPFIREELLLHFSSFPVCSEGCKGLCSTCGVDLNTKRCGCASKAHENPFKSLLK